jgi:hypothetical protein
MPFDAMIKMLFIGTFVWAILVGLLLLLHLTFMMIAITILGQKLGHRTVYRRRLNKPISGIYDLAWEHRDEFRIAGLMRFWRTNYMILFILVVGEAAIVATVALIGIFLNLFAR